MTRFRAYLAASLDGYIASADGTVEWLHAYFSPEIDFAAFERSIGATVVGRRTFDGAMQGRGGKSLVVLTHRPLPPKAAAAGAVAFAGDLRELAATLRAKLAKTGKDVWLMGGGELLRAFAAADLIDRLELAVLPITLGQGVPLFPRHGDGMRPLRLVESKALANGVVTLTYKRAAL